MVQHGSQFFTNTSRVFGGTKKKLSIIAKRRLQSLVNKVCNAYNPHLVSVYTFIPWQPPPPPPSPRPQPFKTNFRLFSKLKRIKPKP